MRESGVKWPPNAKITRPIATKENVIVRHGKEGLFIV